LGAASIGETEGSHRGPRRTGAGSGPASELAQVQRYDRRVGPAVLGREPA
jgi:hypothetical protein